MLNEIDSRKQMRDEFVLRLEAELPGTEVVGAGGPRLWNTVAAMMPQVDGPQRWVVKLDKLGFAVSSGSACSSGKEEPSPVLLAMNFPPERASGVLRFSSGWETTTTDWKALLNGILETAKELAVLTVGNHHLSTRGSRDPKLRR